MFKRNVPLKLFVVLVLFGLAAGLASADPSNLTADTKGSIELLGGIDQPYHYMVKFVCGKVFAAPTGESPLKPGNYATAINIHNYDFNIIVGYKRPALHYAENATTYPPTFPFYSYRLQPLRVLEIDCNDLYRLTGTDPGKFIKGMVDIALPRRLPVVAVYTAEGMDVEGNPILSSGVSIDVEYVEPFLTPPS